MARQPDSPEFNPFEFRPNVGGFPGWGGVVTEGDPGSIPPNRLRRAQNVRFTKGTIINRPGLDLKLSLTSPTFPVVHMGVHPGTMVAKLFGTARGCLGPSVGTGATVYAWDSAISTLMPYVFFFSPTDQNVPMGTYGDELWVSQVSLIRKALIPNVVFPDNGQERGVIIQTGGGMDFPIQLDTNFTTTFIKEFDGKMFIGRRHVTTPNTTSKISVWDGVSIKDDLTGIGVPMSATVLRDRLVVGFDATAGHIRWRAAGDAPGTWTTVALAGFGTGTFGNTMTEFKDAVYIASGLRDLFKYDGTSLTLHRTLAVGSALEAVAAVGDYLFYGYYDTGTGVSLIGRHAPDAAGLLFNDSYKNLTTDLTVGNLSVLVAYQDELVAGGGGSWLGQSKGHDIAGTWRGLANTGGGPLVTTNKWNILVPVFN